jgi:hypothetical protein
VRGRSLDRCDIRWLPLANVAARAISSFDRLIWQVLPFGPLVLGTAMMVAVVVY